MIQASIFRRICLCLIFGQQLAQHCRSFLAFRFLRLRPASANSAKRKSAGSTPLNLLVELWRTWEGTAETVGCDGCRVMPATIGRGLIGVGGVFSVTGELGSDIEVRFRYGIASLVEEKLCSPSTNLGVFGLSRGRSGKGRSREGLLALPTLDLPVNISLIPARIFPNVDGGRWRVRALDERLSAPCSVPLLGDIVKDG